VDVRGSSPLSPTPPFSSPVSCSSECWRAPQYVKAGDPLATTARAITVDDLALLPDDGFRYEIERGELVRLPLSNFNSSQIGIEIARLLSTWAKEHSAGRVAGADGAYVLQQDPLIVRIPDVSFVAADRLPPREEWQRFLALAPDLAVEVVSPSDTVRDMTFKVIEYLDFGVRMVWVVFPDSRAVQVYFADRSSRLLSANETLDGGDVLPGFSLPIATLFE
jgi:Uma2 family endonuclease